MSAQDSVANDTTLDEQLGLDQLPEGIDDPMILRDRVNKLENAKKQLTARAKKAEEEARTLKEAGVKAEAPPVISTSDSKPYEINDEVVDLRLDGYSKPEVEYIMKNGGRKELEDTTSYLSIAINTKREQTRAEEAANGTQDTAGLSEVERKYTPQQLAAMSVKELEALLPHAD